jgi:hypothetical protein
MLKTLPLPMELTRLIERGLWPRDSKEALSQNVRPWISESSVRRFAPEESKVYLYPPPFCTVRVEMESPKHSFWADPRSAVQEINPDLTMIIGDFGLGSDAPIALDYRQQVDEPRVIRLRWAPEGNHWVEAAPTFAEFAAHLTCSD